MARIRSNLSGAFGFNRLVYGSAIYINVFRAGNSLLPDVVMEMFHEECKDGWNEV